MNTRFLVTDFGDVNNGWAQATGTIQKAINMAATVGGGTVVFPRGIFRCGTLELRSNVTLELTNGAVLLASGDLEEYRPIAESHGDRHPYHLIVARGCENIGIRGPGVIDGNAAEFWEDASNPRTPIKVKRRLVTPLIEFVDCKDVRVSDVFMRNSPGWTLHLQRCERAWVHCVRIENDLRAPDCDGIVVNGSREVWIRDSSIVTGTDAVALKAWRDAAPCERVTVSRCYIRAHGAALACGPESAHPIRDIVFSDCVVYGSHTGVALHAVEGAPIEEVLVHDIVVDTRCNLLDSRPLVLNARPLDTAVGVAPVIRGVTVRNLRALTDGRMIMAAANGGVIEDVRLDDVTLRYPVVEKTARYLEPAMIEERIGSPEARNVTAALVAENVQQLRVTNFDVRWPSAAPAAEWLPEWKRLRNTAEILQRDTWLAEAKPVVPALWLRGVNAEIGTKAQGLNGAPTIDARDCQLA
ncbi:MAG TPA: glycosyl hydrolase family 28 protein [Opitutaceae bacterium]|nr:glycosyl hydrolase family 28 protein [Opitutaceae bacterium]